uniref:Stathmin n=2 Tax=Macrostomum lignano TaxID=282301 RepID=A0A1I8JKQ1_9PLAT
MGCGSSTAASASAAGQPIQVQPRNNGGLKASVESKPAVPAGNGFALAHQPTKLPPIKSEQKQQNDTAAVEDEKIGKGGVAFNIPVGSGGDANGAAAGAASTADIDKILRKPLPPRLRHLEPLENAPSISPEQLAEKLRKAEEKRERMLEKRRNSSVTKQSKARREMLKAQEFSGQQEAASGAGEAAAAAAPNPEAEKLQQKQAVAEQKRLAKLAAVQERQRQREERAKAARERARRLKEEEQMEAELNIEKDEGGGDSDSDASWLGEGDAPARGAPSAAEDGTGGLPLMTGVAGEQPQHRDSSGYGSSRGGGGGSSSLGGSRATTGKTVSTVVEDDQDRDFYE